MGDSAIDVLGQFKATLDALPRASIETLPYEMSNSTGDASGGDESAQDRQLVTSRRGYSLVGLLVTLVCIVVLLSITLPAMRTATTGMNEDGTQRPDSAGVRPR